MPKLYLNTLWKYLILKPALLLAVVFLFTANAYSQCPANIDFEQGDFTGWQCYIQDGYTGGPPSPLPSAAIPGRHDIITAATMPTRDPYGNFPVLCPNGSGYSARIGHTTTGGQMVDKISYTFTIPANQNTFTLIYHYALVLNDGGSNHNSSNQPIFIIQSRDITNGVNLPCQLADINVATNLPGFFTSVNTAPNGSLVKCRTWAAGSLNLDGYAGRTIEISFTVTGCGLGGGTHFGYAYLDVNTQCGSAFDGAVFCPDDTAVTVTAPVGYQTYNWYNGVGTVLLGTGQSLTLNPPPLAGDSLKVELIPFNGYGCLDTLTAYLWDTLTIRADAGLDKETCDNNPVQLGGPPEPNRIYKWSPATGLSNPDIANPIATPSVTTTYMLTVTNGGGGCATLDTATVTVDVLSDSIQQIGPSSQCTVSPQTVLLKVLPHDSVQWYRNGNPIPGATQTQYIVTQTGAYHAMVFSSAGCTRTTVVKQIDMWESPVFGFATTPATVQCFNNNQFIFTNSSTVSTGTLQYAWDMGDGNTFTTRDVTHSYTKEGAYTVKLLVTAPGGCADSGTVNVVINPSPLSAFTVDVPEQCFKNNWFVFNTKSTITSGVLTYVWDFGDGTFDNSNDIAHRYAIPDTFSVRLIATETNGGCWDDSVMQVIVHPSPVADFTANSYNQCFPGHDYILTNNSTIYSGAMQYLWTFGDGTSDNVQNPTHKYARYGNYTIKLLIDAAGGCSDSVSRNVEIYPVPDADFSVQSICQDLRVPVINRTTNISNSTVNYFWDFGNGHLDNVYTPVYAYTTPGKYTITLRVSTAQCPVSFNSISRDVVIERAITGITYPDKDAAYNYNEQLQARNIGNKVLWTPATNLSNRYSYSPVFRGLTPQLYTVQLTTDAGCVTVDTQLVKTHKKIEIYVPNGFTPGNDNINERLRPVLIGFSKVNYFRIYNRWGKLLFSMNSDQPGWDGKVNGNPVDMQTVVWMIEAVDVDGKVHNKQGTTVIIR